jgi:hypothetical protein
LIGVTYHSLPYLTFSIIFLFVVLSFGSGCYMYPKKVVPSSSYEKKGLECPRLMQAGKRMENEMGYK